MAQPENSDLLASVMQLHTEQDSDGFAKGIRHLVNEAMIRGSSAALRKNPASAPRGQPRPRQRLQRQDHLHPRGSHHLQCPTGLRWLGVLSLHPRQGIHSEQAPTKPPPSSYRSASPPSFQGNPISGELARITRLPTQQARAAVTRLLDQTRTTKESFILLSLATVALLRAGR